MAIDPQVIIASDIFGISKATDELALWLQQQGIKTQVCDPYHGQRHRFENEQHAYQFFIAAGGHELYFKQLKALMLTSNASYLIGFSAGANAAWRLAADPAIKSTLQLLCFYPSQLGKYNYLQPNKEVHLVLPNREVHFDIERVAKEMLEKDKVDVTCTEFGHGFMNMLSAPYSLAAEDAGRNLITAFLSENNGLLRA